MPSPDATLATAPSSPPELVAQLIALALGEQTNGHSTLCQSCRVHGGGAEEGARAANEILGDYKAGIVPSPRLTRQKSAKC